VVLWVYYSAQVFLLGAEFARAWAGLEDGDQGAPVGQWNR
jgi:membrane protein